MYCKWAMPFRGLASMIDRPCYAMTAWTFTNRECFANDMTHHIMRSFAIDVSPRDSSRRHTVDDAIGTTACSFFLSGIWTGKHVNEQIRVPVTSLVDELVTEMICRTSKAVNRDRTRRDPSPRGRIFTLQCTTLESNIIWFICLSIINRIERSHCAWIVLLHLLSIDESRL